MSDNTTVGGYPRGLRLSAAQDQTLRRWPLERIRPKSVALGVRSLFAEVDALRADLDALTAERDALRARAERAEAALVVWHLSDQLHIAHFRFNAGGYGPASSYGDDGEQALADFRALMPDGMTVPRDYEGMKNRD